MDWEAIGAIGEVLGAFAVVATLLYLALQTRKNAQAIDATASRDAAYHLSEFHREVARDPELLRVAMKAFSDEMPTYTAEEWFQLRVFVISVFMLYQTQYIHRGLDIGSVEESEKNMSYANGLVSTFPAVAAMWAELEAEGNFLQGFVDAVNNASASSDYTGIRKDIAGERLAS